MPQWTTGLPDPPVAIATSTPAAQIVLAARTEDVSARKVCITSVCNVATLHSAGGRQHLAVNVTGIPPATTAPAVSQAGVSATQGQTIRNA